MLTGQMSYGIVGVWETEGQYPQEGQESPKTVIHCTACETQLTQKDKRTIQEHSPSINKNDLSPCFPMKARGGLITYSSKEDTTISSLHSLQEYVSSRRLARIFRMLIGSRLLTSQEERSLKNHKLRYTTDC